MSSTVGSKGQIVIKKEFRDRLGVEPGWRALQFLVRDRVEIHLMPPEHNRSLAGCLSPYVKRSLPGPEELAEARADAWSETVTRRMTGDGAE